MEDNSLQKVSETRSLAGVEQLRIEDVLAQVKAVQQLMTEVMQENTHYGRIPGCGEKPSLLKPGAEKLGVLFRLRPDLSTERIDLPHGHREYSITCRLYNIANGKEVGQGVGLCSTMESKYRYRKGEGENTGEPVPSEYWTARDKNLIGGKGFATKKVDGKWFIFKESEKAENPDIADMYNTVFKMAKKRALVDAMLTATGASDIFTQDIEDFREVVIPNYEVAIEATPLPEKKPVAKKRTKVAEAPQQEAPEKEPVKEKSLEEESLEAETLSNVSEAKNDTPEQNEEPIGIEEDVDVDALPDDDGEPMYHEQDLNAIVTGEQLNDFMYAKDGDVERNFKLVELADLGLYNSKATKEVNIKNLTEGLTVGMVRDITEKYESLKEQ